MKTCPSIRGYRDRPAPPVHLDEPGRPLHDAVQLGGEDILVRSQAYVNRLAASPEGQKRLARLQVARHRNGMGSLETAHGQPERLRQVVPLQQVAFDLEGDDLRIGGERRCNELLIGLQFLPQLRIIVDVAVEDDVNGPVSSAIPGVCLASRPVRQGEAVHGMAVLFRDRTDGSPAGMGHGRLQERLLPDEEPEDRVFGNGLAEFPDIPPEFPDDGGRLVDEIGRHIPPSGIGRRPPAPRGKCSR